MEWNDLREQYSRNLFLDGKRKVGLEQEYPLVYSSGKEYGRAVLWPDTLNLLMDIMENNGWMASYDDRNNHLASLERADGTVISTEFGACTLEIAMPPFDRLHDAEVNFRTLLGEIVSVASDNDIYLLGYGIQPVTPPSHELVAPKSRYATLDKRFWTTEKLTHPNTDVHFHTINASNQVHVDVSEDEAVMAVNMMNKFTPSLVALCGNSSIWMNQISPYSDVREICWDWVVNIPQDRYRKGIAPEMSDLDEYLNTILEFQPILTVRDNTYWELVGVNTMREYLDCGFAFAVEPGAKDRSKAIKLNPEDIDMIALDGTTWWDARLQNAYGTVELRCCSQQRLEDAMTVPALALGLINNLDEAWNFVSGYSTDIVKKARIDAITKGMRSKINGSNIVDITSEMVDIAEAGLCSIGESTCYLDPLRSRIESKKNPSDRAIEQYNSEGIKGLIEYTRLRL